DKRWVAVVDSNADDQLAVVPLTTQNHSNTTPLYGYKTGNNKNTYFRHFVEIEDSQGSPITVDGDKFKENNPEYDLSEQNLRQVRDKVFTKSKQASRNRSKLEILKSWFSRKK
ncbi:MAG: hypothetical protein FWD49_07925, partial [Firmicutes bacterium]|nr:hypothetical protein [Bacillota bacterium]